jgi:hypothetical protein
MAKKKARRAPAKTKAVTSAPMDATPMELPTVTPTEPVTETPVVTEVAPRKRSNFVGVWAYIIGIVVAFAAAIFMRNGLDYWTYAVLAILGLVVGLLNITDDEVLLFLVASVAFMVSANGVRVVLHDILFIETFMNGIIIFTAAGAFIVSFKALYKVAKNE